MSWRRRSAIWVVAVVVIGLLGYTGYVGFEGSRQLVSRATDRLDCRTPEVQFGWDYEAINYDIDDDALLAGRNEDLLADDRGIGQRHREVLDVAAEPLVTALDRVAHGVEIVDVALHDGVLGQRFDGVALDPIHALAGALNLDHLDRRGTDIGTDQRRHLGLEQALDRVEIETKFSFEHRSMGRLSHSLH